MHMLEIAKNPNGYHIHSGVVLPSYAPAKNQATPAWDHTGDHNFSLDNLHSYGSWIEMKSVLSWNALSANQYCGIIGSYI